MVGEMAARGTSALTVGRGGSSVFHLSGSESRELIVPLPLLVFTPFFRQLHRMPLSVYVIVCSVILLFK